jgi:hypothetical protein
MRGPFERTRRLRVSARDPALRVPAAALGRALGYELLLDDHAAADVCIVSRAEVERWSGESSAQAAPAILVSPRRLPHAQAERLRAAGVRVILDPDATRADLATAILEQGVGFARAQRAYLREHGAPSVVVLAEGARLSGRLRALTRRAVLVEGDGSVGAAEVAAEVAAALGRRLRVEPWTRLRAEVEIAGVGAPIVGELVVGTDDAFALERCPASEAPASLALLAAL